MAELIQAYTDLMYQLMSNPAAQFLINFYSRCPEFIQKSVLASFSFAAVVFGFSFIKEVFF